MILFILKIIFEPFYFNFSTDFHRIITKIVYFNGVSVTFSMENNQLFQFMIDLTASSSDLGEKLGQFCKVCG